MYNMFKKDKKEATLANMLVDVSRVGFFKIGSIIIALLKAGGT